MKGLSDSHYLNLNSHLNSLAALSVVSSALSPQNWLFGLEWLPTSAYLVGGSVRDALLGRTGDYLDLDFVLPTGAVETAEAIARHYKAGYVLLDAERQIARVVFKHGTADFARQVGDSLEADLERRDFTVNAIAYDPHNDRIIDPLQGYADLQQRQIRMVSPANLEEDPLRLLRAYRQAAQLGFAVGAATRREIQRLAPLLRRIAAERVQSEINYLVSTAKGTPWLYAAWEDGLLQDWFPAATADSIARVAATDRAALLLQETLPAFYQELMSSLRHPSKTERSQAGSALSLPISEVSVSGSTRNWLTMARLAWLLPPDYTAAEGQLRQLKYSRNEIQAITIMLRFLPQLCEAVVVDSDRPPVLTMSLREQCLFFQAVGTTFPAVAVLAIANGLPQAAIAPMLQRYVTPHDPVAHPSPLLTGQTLMQSLKLPPGPQIGQLLAEIQLARAEGLFDTQSEALAYAANLIGDAPAFNSNQ